MWFQVHSNILRLLCHCLTLSHHVTYRTVTIHVFLTTPFYLRSLSALTPNFLVLSDDHRRLQLTSDRCWLRKRRTDVVSAGRTKLRLSSSDRFPRRGSLENDAIVHALLLQCYVTAGRYICTVNMTRRPRGHVRTERVPDTLLFLFR